MQKFHEDLRYSLDHLTPESVVLDVGAFEGRWAAEINRKYGCTVHAFEPVPEFFNNCVRRFDGNPKIRMWPFGLGNSDRNERFGIKGDMSGAHCTSPNESVDVVVRDVVDFFRSHIVSRCHAAKINAEGSEYEILEALIDAGLIHLFDHISTQFHTCAPDYEMRHNLIRLQLEQTHDLAYDEKFVWTAWDLRR